MLSINGNITAKVKHGVSKNDIDLYASIPGIYRYEGYLGGANHDFKRGYLRKLEDGTYIYYVLQKNGEPSVGVEVTFGITQMWDISPIPYVRKLKTDEKGIVTLGKLEGVMKFKLNIQTF